MGLESPVGGAVHTGGGESVKAELCGAGMNVISDSLQGLEVLDFVHGMTGLLDESLVGDDAVGFDNVRNAANLAFGILQSEILAGEFLGDGCVGQISAIILPVCQTDRAVDLEQGGSVCLCDFGCECGLVGAFCCGQNVNLHAGLLGVQLGEILPLLILLRLELQIVNMTLAFVSRAIVTAALAGCQTGQCRCQQHCRCK